MPSSDDWFVLEFLFTEVGIVRRGPLGQGLPDADLTFEFEGITGRLAQKKFHRNGQFIAEALRRAGQGLGR